MQDLIAQSRAVRRKSEELRIRAVQTRIEATSTFCSSAEIEARWESPEKAASTLDKVRLAIQHLYHHIEQPEHVPPAMRDQLHAQVAAIEDRTRGIRGLLNERVAAEKHAGIDGRQSPLRP